MNLPPFSDMILNELSSVPTSAETLDLTDFSAVRSAASQGVHGMRIQCTKGPLAACTLIIVYPDGTTTSHDNTEIALGWELVCHFVDIKFTNGVVAANPGPKFWIGKRT